MQGVRLEQQCTEARTHTARGKGMMSVAGCVQGRSDSVSGMPRAFVWLCHGLWDAVAPLVCVGLKLLKGANIDG